MKALLHTLFICSILLCAHSAMAQEEPTVKTTQLTERLYLLSTNQGEYTTNTIASVGPDGLLLVDTQLEEDAEALKAVVDAFGKSSTQVVTWADVDFVNNTIVVNKNIDALGQGLKEMAESFGDFLSETLGTLDIPFIDTTSLAEALNGLIVPEVRPKDLPLADTSQVGSTGEVQLDNVTSFLLRLFEAGGLDLSQVQAAGAIGSGAVSWS